MNKNRLLIIILCIILISFGILILKPVIQSSKDKSSYKEKDSNEIVEKISSYNNPIIPTGFKSVETNEASWKLNNGIPQGWNDGLVIEDDIGNQFVWVPVNLEDINFDEQNLKNNYFYNKDKMDVNDIDDVQILKYGGFYIARYEAGLPKEVTDNTSEFSKVTNNISGIPNSKKEQIVWNYIDWNTAKLNSKEMYKRDDIQSDLITTKQWSSIMKWLSKKGYDIENSIKWGNYSNNNFIFSGYYSTDYGKTYNFGNNVKKQTYNMILSTGATDRNKANNIYDLAGNVSEFADIHRWINIYGEEEEDYRNWGGYYDNISYYSANSNMSISDANSRQGFRVVLYFK